MTIFSKTIIAQSTPVGNSGIGIIRISGKKSLKISKLLTKKNLKPRYAKYTYIKNKNNIILDYVIIIYYKSPHSFTGEDIIEIQSHGGQKMIELIIKSILNFKLKNIRIAKPGEFSERAFINKKIDLTQAEAINYIIHAKSENEIFLATNLLKGYLSKKIKKIIKIIKNNLIFIEKEINFSEKNIKNRDILKLKKNNLIIKKKLKKLYYKCNNFFLNENNKKIIIIGKPNVGKSSLMNYLTKKDTSIVTNIIGTTRDIIKSNININNNNMEIIDTAGIHKTKNKIEKIGIKKTWKEINNSKIIIFLDDSSISNNNIINNYKKNIQYKIKNYKKKINILLRNKIDLIKKKFKFKKINSYNIIWISIKKKIGLKKIIKIIKNKIKNINIKNTFLIKQRYIDLIKKTLSYIKKIEKLIKIYFFNKTINYDLISYYFFKSQKKLSKIIGIKKYTSKKIINDIFSKFCIGK